MLCPPVRPFHRQLPRFDEHLQAIEDKLSRRIPEPERKERELQRLMRVAAGIPGLARRFSPALRDALRVLARGPPDDAEEALAELEAFCALLRYPMPGAAAVAALRHAPPAERAAGAQALHACALATLARAQVSPQRLRDSVFRRVAHEVADAFAAFEAASGQPPLG